MDRGAWRATIRGVTESDTTEVTEQVLNLLQYYVLVFWHQACGISAPQLGIELAHSTLEGKVLSTAPAGRWPSRYCFEVL